MKLGEHNVHTGNVAVKILTLGKVKRQDVRKEICVHKMLHHPNIVKFLDFDTDRDQTTIFLLLELSPGGELFDKIGPRAAPFSTFTRLRGLMLAVGSPGQRLGAGRDPPVLPPAHRRSGEEEEGPPQGNACRPPAHPPEGAGLRLLS